MDTKTLQALITVVDECSFAAAARTLDQDPSSVSRTISALEDEIGVRLLQRSTRKLALTEAGQRYLARVAPLVEELARAKEEAHTLSHTLTGTLRITASVAFGHACLVPLMPAFQQQHPQLTTELLLTDEKVDLIRQGIDLAIRLGPSREPELIGAKLMNTHYRVVASPAYLSQHPALYAPQDLTQHQCVLLSVPGYRDRWLFRDAHKQVEEVPVQGRMVLSPVLAVRDAARLGMGPALLANWMVSEDLASGTLVDVFPQHDVTATTFETAAWLQYPSRSYLPAKVQAMMTFLRGQVSTH